MEFSSAEILLTVKIDRNKFQLAVFGEIHVS